MNKMGTYIKRKRMERGLSVSELAQMIGVTEYSMSRTISQTSSLLIW